MNEITEDEVTTRWLATGGRVTKDQVRADLTARRTEADKQRTAAAAKIDTAKADVAKAQEKLQLAEQTASAVDGAVPAGAGAPTASPAPKGGK